MSWIILKGSKREIWNNTTFPTFEVAKNNLHMAYTRHRFKRSDDDLTWISGLNGVVFRFLEVKDYQEKPVLTMDELFGKHEKLLEIFKLYSNVFQFENDEGKVSTGRRIVDCKWRAMASDILSLFERQGKSFSLIPKNLTAAEKDAFVEQWNKLANATPLTWHNAVLGNAPSITDSPTIVDLEQLVDLRKQGITVIVNEKENWSAALDFVIGQMFELVYVCQLTKGNVYFFKTISGKKSVTEIVK